MTLRFALAAMTLGLLAACEAPTQTSGTSASAQRAPAQAEIRRQNMARFYGPRGGSR